MDAVRLAERMGRPLARLLGPSLRRRPRGVFYHLAGPHPRAHVRALYETKTPEQLALDLRYLKESFHVAGHEEVVWHQRRQKSLPAGSVTISFDDGLAECFSTIRPLLLENGLPGTFFVCEAFIDNRSMMHRNRAALAIEAVGRLEPGAWDAIREPCSRLAASPLATPGDLVAWLRSVTFRQETELDAICELLEVDVAGYLREQSPYMTGEQVDQLHREGFTIGAHSLRHPELWLCDGSRMEAEMRGSCLAVQERTGMSRVPFAFPFTGAMLSRRRLAALLADIELIDLMYDTAYLRRDRSFIVNRIPADAPGQPGDRSNLPDLMARAEALEPLRAARRLLRPHLG